MKRRAPKRPKARQTLLSEQAVDALLVKLSNRDQALTDKDFEALLGVVQTWAHLTEVAAQDSASIREIRRLLGIRLREHCHQRESESTVVTKATPEKEDEEDEPGDPEDDPSPPSKNRNEHGRRSVDAFDALEHVHHPHVALGSGDICPGCLRGRVYKYRPNSFTAISGRSPLVATRHTVESLQCNSCKKKYLSFPRPYPPSSRLTASVAARSTPILQ